MPVGKGGNPRSNESVDASSLSRGLRQLPE